MRQCAQLLFHLVVLNFQRRLSDSVTLSHCDTLCTVTDTLCLFNLLLIAVIAAAIVNRPTFSHYLPPIVNENWTKDSRKCIKVSDQSTHS